MTTVHFTRTLSIDVQYAGEIGRNMKASLCIAFDCNLHNRIANCNLKGPVHFRKKDTSNVILSSYFSNMIVFVSVIICALFMSISAIGIFMRSGILLLIPNYLSFSPRRFVAM